MTEQPDLMTVEELGQLLRLAPATIRNRVALGLHPRPYKLGHRLRFLRTEVLEWLEAQRKPDRSTPPPERVRPKPDRKAKRAKGKVRS